MALIITMSTSSGLALILKYFIMIQEFHITTRNLTAMPIPQLRVVYAMPECDLPNHLR